MMHECRERKMFSATVEKFRQHSLHLWAHRCRQWAWRQTVHNGRVCCILKPHTTQLTAPTDTVERAWREGLQETPTLWGGVCGCHFPASGGLYGHFAATWDGLGDRRTSSGLYGRFVATWAGLGDRRTLSGLYGRFIATRAGLGDRRTSSGLYGRFLATRAGLDDRSAACGTRPAYRLSIWWQISTHTQTQTSFTTDLGPDFQKILGQTVTIPSLLTGHFGRWPATRAAHLTGH